VDVVYWLTELQVDGESGEMGEVTWSLMAPRAGEKLDDEADDATVVCVNYEDAQQPAAAAAAAESATTESRAVGNGSDVNR